MGWRKGNSLQFDTARSGHISGMGVIQDLETTATQNSSEESRLIIHRKLFLRPLKLLQAHLILPDINFGALLLP